MAVRSCVKALLNQAELAPHPPPGPMHALPPSQIPFISIIPFKILLVFQTTGQILPPPGSLPGPPSLDALSAYCVGPTWHQKGKLGSPFTFCPGA